ncbi:MAG: thiamine pyrophosphate-dependent enzyme, partial [Chloroflexota bacterium]|nr:thiamine pyrophosphate-dependent enzyme [Chloroflexota bacterium]
EALNFAGVFQAPVVLVIQNNGWAISVPRHKQSAASALALRGAGFGVPFKLVDGNDILAVYDTMKKAVDGARSGQGPTLIETLTYRIGAHTTADDPTRYRNTDEVEAWRSKDPIVRFEHFLKSRDLLTDEQKEQMLEEIENQINEAVAEAEAMPAMAPDSFFDYTSATLSARQQEQRQDLLRYVNSNTKG